MAVVNFDFKGRPAPYTISIKRIGDSTERFVSLAGTLATFTPVIGGDQSYESTVTDAAGNKSVKAFSLDCTRLPDCKEGPVLLNILEVTTTFVRYQFHAADVPQLLREVVQNGLVVDEVIDLPEDNIVTSYFTNPIAAGAYDLRLTGYSCYSLPSSKGFTLADAAQILAWTPGFPKFEQYGAKYRVLTSINRAGDYFTQIIYVPNGATVTEGVKNYAPGSVVPIENLNAGEYDVKVGALTARLNVGGSTPMCEEGPNILSLTPGSDQTTFTFHAKNVPVLNWIYETQAGAEVIKGTVTATGSQVTITHARLNPGTYTFKISGAGCISAAPGYSAMPAVIGSTVLSINSAAAVLQANGQYKLDLVFSGGKSNYLVQVKAQNNTVLAFFPNVTGSPLSVSLPAGILPQTVKISVTDALNAIAENSAVVLPALKGVVSLYQYPDLLNPAIVSPIENNGVTYPMRSTVGYKWDIEYKLPNNGLYDHVTKYIKKRINGNLADVNIQNITGQPAGVSVTASTDSVKLLTPRNTTDAVIDGQNPFKVSGTYVAGFIARKGGASGTIINTEEREFIMAVPAAQSGINLYARSGDTVGALLYSLPTTGGSYVKPVPLYDLATTDFGGVQFNNLIYYFRQKVNGVYVQRFVNSINWQALRTTVTPADTSLFKGANFSNVHVSILAAEVQDWQIEIVARNGSNTVASKIAEFTYTIGTTSFVNSGFERKVINGRSYQFSIGMDFGIKPLATDKVSLYIPATRSSLNSRNTVYPWIYLNHVRLHPDDQAALLSPTGLYFPDGRHTLTIMWFSNVVQNYDDVIDGGAKGNAYNLAGEDLNSTMDSGAMPDSLTFTIRKLTQVNYAV